MMGVDRFDLPAERVVHIGLGGFFKNNQQLLDIRMDSKIGFGKFLINQSTALWMMQTGLNSNNEEFMNEFPAKSSLEGELSTSLSLISKVLIFFLILFSMKVSLKKVGFGPILNWM